MPSGWARWILEQFEFDFEVVYPQRLDRGNLNTDFDVLVFVNGAKVSVKEITERLTGHDNAVEKATRFEFYTVLPGKEMVVPDAPPPARDASPVASEPVETQPVASSTDHSGKYMLQVGSFKTAADADSEKARLALLGLQAGVQKVDLGRQGIWHRVRLGPYPGRERADAVKRRLETDGIKVLTTRLR